MIVADRIGVMDKTVKWRRRASEAPFALIAGFVGDINLIEGQAARQAAPTIATDSAGTSWRRMRLHRIPVRCAMIRPESRLSQAAAPAPHAINTLAGEITSAGFR